MARLGTGARILARGGDGPPAIRLFKGLALSLMAGEVASTALSRLAVPVLYFLVARRERAARLAKAGPGGQSVLKAW